MKKVLFTAVLILSMLIPVSAQVALTIYSGVGRSSFDKNIINNSITDLADFSQAEYIPIGAQLTFSLPLLFNFRCRCELCSGTVYI